MLFSKNRTNYETYIKLLKDENEKLYRRISRLEGERDHADAAREKSTALLNKYKSEYEALIADAKKLIEKQKKTDDAMNKIMETCNNELQNLIEMKGR